MFSESSSGRRCSSFSEFSRSHEQNIINLTRRFLKSHNCTGLLFLTHRVCILVIPSRCGYFLIESHSGSSIGKADHEGSFILLRSQNVADL